MSFSEVISRYSERYQMMGGLAATGVLNQLGRPDMERAEVVVREALQNCWDAKLPDANLVRVDIGRTTLAPAASTALRELLADPPQRGLPLSRVLGSAPDVLLHFADYGTSGLGGPVRADLAGEPRDYIDFVLNVGQPPDKQMGGGSFGYGKAAFYLASRARTVIIDTVCDSGNGVERRLIACALGSNYSDSANRTFTGRHWWGWKRDGGPVPVTGPAADDLAARLGLPTRGPGDRGTTVAILAPDIVPSTDEDHEDDGRQPGRQAELTMRFIADAVVWNFWPRMVSTSTAQQATLEVTVTDDGSRVPLIDPRTHPQLRGFVEALDGLRLEAGRDDPLLIDRPVERLKPHASLGRLVIARGPAAPFPTAPTVPPTRGARELGNGVHHVALMRTPEIVVKYMRCEAPVHAGHSYSGVFKCEVDADDAFKESEPPTHDDWVYKTATDADRKSMVKVALDRIRATAREAAGQSGTLGTQAGPEIPLGELSDALARLIPGLSGSGARYRPPKLGGGPRTGGMGDGGSGGGGPRTGGIEQTPVKPSDSVPHLGMTEGGTAVLVFPFAVARTVNIWEVSGDVEVMNRDGDMIENDRPAGEPELEVHSWVAPSGVVHVGPVLQLLPGTGGAWLARVERRGEFMARLNLNAVLKGGSE